LTIEMKNELILFEYVCIEFVFCRSSFSCNTIINNLIYGCMCLFMHIFKAQFTTVVIYLNKNIPSCFSFPFDHVRIKIITNDMAGITKPNTISIIV